MKFLDLYGSTDPAYEIFKVAQRTVFDRGDGTTEHIDRLSKEGRLVYLLWCFDGEVHNGGFDQLFFNSLGDYWEELLDGLLVVGAKRSHELLASALSWFPDSSPSTSRQLRWSQLKTYCQGAAYEKDIERLDSEFYKYEDNLSGLINAYVRQHPDAMIDGREKL